MAAEITAKDLLKTEGIITCDPSSTLNQALAKLQSSHDAVFVVGKKNKLLGVISPYYVMYKSSYPPTTKAENCLFSPPKLKLTTPISEIARHMILAKVYYLPVFAENGTWAGIISARTLLQAVASDNKLREKLEITRKSKSIITIKQTTTLSEARTLLRSKGVSRLPVVSEAGKLVGILTRYDLREALSTPKTSQSFLSRSGQKKKFQNQPVRKFIKTSVETATFDTPIWQMITTLLEKNIGSIVVVNSKWQPVSILSFKDVLAAVVAMKSKKERVLEILLPEDFEQTKQLTELVKKLHRKLVRKSEVKFLQINLETQRNRANEISQFNVKATARTANGRYFYSQTTNYDWKIAVREAIKKISRQSTTN